MDRTLMPSDTPLQIDEDEYEEQILDAFPEIQSIEDDDLREKTIEAWTLALDRGGWRDIHDIPHTGTARLTSPVRVLRSAFDSPALDGP